MSEAKTPLVERLRTFFERELWAQDLRPRTIATAFTRFLQFSMVIAENFVRDQLFLRSGALTYITVLAMIPGIAMVLSVLKGLGVSEDLAHVIVSQIPAVTNESRQQMLDLIQGVDLGGLGTVGASVFVVTTILALRHLEVTLNDIWGVTQSRGWARRFADYLAVLIFGPFLMSAALSLGATIQAAPLFSEVASMPVIHTIYALGLEWVPVGIIAVALTFLYWFFPNTRVKLVPAVLGGVIAAILFSATQYSYVAFSVGAAKYNALFGGFAVVPLMLVWIYASWSIVLMGAEISFACQNLGQYRRDRQEHRPGTAEREALGIQIVVRVAWAFRDRKPALTASELAERVDVSVRTVNDICRHLDAAGVLSTTAAREGGTAFQLGRPAEDIRLAEILGGLRGTRRAVTLGQDEVADLVEGILGELRGLESPLSEGRTIGDLLHSLPPIDSASASP